MSSERWLTAGPRSLLRLKSASNVSRLWPRDRAVARTIPSMTPKAERPFFRFADLIAAASRQISLVRDATLAICSRASSLAAV